jgi:hypothetical protein
MNAKLDAKLCKLAPHLFADRYASMRTTALCWGFECGDGWYSILAEVATKLEPLCKAEHDRYAHLEKRWYRHVRSILGFFGRTPFYGTIYRLVNKALPNLSNPFHWYGGGPRASQVKEKFGTLRFYMTHSTEEMSTIIQEAEKKSAKTCETCGKAGKLRGYNWYYNRCAPCWKKERKAI